MVVVVALVEAGTMAVVAELELVASRTDFLPICPSFFCEFTMPTVTTHPSFSHSRCSRVEAGSERVTFRVRGQDVAFRMAWVMGDIPYREVAGPGRKLKGDTFPAFALVTDRPERLRDAARA